MALMSILTSRTSLNLLNPKPNNNSLSRRTLKHACTINVLPAVLPERTTSIFVSQVFKPSFFRIRSIQREDAGNYETAKDALDVQHSSEDEAAHRDLKDKATAIGSPFLLILVIAVGVAAIVTVVSAGVRWPNSESFFGIQCLPESSVSSIKAAAPVGFALKAFGYRIILPEYAPGWIYFWLLMAAGCGLFISEEALNIWVGITLSRMLSLNGTWSSFIESFSRHAPYIISTVVWVYWGVCISDMIPFYLGKLFRQSGATDDIYLKLGIGEEKTLKIRSAVQKYGNLIGIVERFSLGVRNPTAFVAGALGVSPERFFAGVCCGGLITLLLQLGIGFLLRERPVFALATVATVVGIWTVFPYFMAACTALFLYLRQRYST